MTSQDSDRTRRSHEPTPVVGPWRVRSSRPIFRDRWLNLRADDCTTASGRDVSPYYVLEVPDFAHVVALDRGGNIVLVRQYRHGARLTSLELPGGVVDPADGSPVAAAVRELQEETGFAGKARLVHTLTADPARYDNRLHLVLVSDAVKVCDPTMDDSKEIEVILLPTEEAVSRAMTGGLINAVHVGLLMMGLRMAGQPDDWQAINATR
jgi:8-oxo-dGTP pyrophosphatase MutT (NUDIX family)